MGEVYPGHDSVGVYNCPSLLHESVLLTVELAPSRARRVMTKRTTNISISGFGTFLTAAFTPHGPLPATSIFDHEDPTTKGPERCYLSFESIHRSPKSRGEDREYCINQGYLWLRQHSSCNDQSAFLTLLQRFTSDSHLARTRWLTMQLTQIQPLLPLSRGHPRYRFRRPGSRCEDPYHSYRLPPTYINQARDLVNWREDKLFSNFER